ncbi:MAG TPA: hypothetical protein VIJ79_14860 [Acidobacteriaceae bacterium]
MTYWNQRRAVLYLSPEGANAFGIDTKDSAIDVVVEWADELGLWIFYEQVDDDTRSVRLLKWSHFETATLDIVTAEPERKDAIGFLPHLVKDPKIK